MAYWCYITELRIDLNMSFQKFGEDMLLKLYCNGDYGFSLLSTLTVSSLCPCFTYQ